MKRALAVLASSLFVLAIGCKDYDFRLEKTLEERKYEKRLNDNLQAAPTKGALQGDKIFIRPPLGLEGPTPTFTLTASRPGSLTSRTASSTQKKGTSLHVVARVKKPKAAPRKEGSRRRPPSPPPGASSSTTSSSWSRRLTTSSSLPAELKADSQSHGNRINSTRP